MPAENKPQFSIIVPAYNVEPYIPECINSILAQNFQDFELILVDDGSTDGTSKICDDYQKTAKTKIRVVHQPNAGLSAARNSGVAASSGEYLLFLDGDDFLENHALMDIYDSLEPELDLLRFQAQEIFDDGKKIRYPETGFATTTGVKAFPKLARYHFTENAWLYAYRRDFFVDNNFQYAVGCIAEDFGLTPYIIACASKVKAIPNICYDYRQRSGSIMRGAASALQRTSDIAKQLEQIIPQVAKIPDTAPILHYLVTSFLTDATALNYADFSRFYCEAKQSGRLRYVRPSSLKALPRVLLLKYWPSAFYNLYRRKDVLPRLVVDS